MSDFQINIKSNIISTGLEAIKKYTENIPGALDISERVNYLNSILDKIDREDLLKIKTYLNYLLNEMFKKQASDMELGGFGADGFVWFRIFGAKSRIEEFPKLSFDESALLILSSINEKQRQLLFSNKSLDFSYSISLDDSLESNFNDSIGLMRFRATAYFDVDTLAISVRSILPQLRKLESLGFHPNLLRVLSFNVVKQGLVLITGVTGTGKSTTLDAIIDWHNKNVNAHLVTIASPLEYIHKSGKCIIRQREVGKDVLSFGEGVVQALRQDLDIMVIGEMRDQDTIVAALEVTDTGHKVFSTLHTSSAIESIERIIGEINESEQTRIRHRLADLLVAVISQKLVPDIKGKLVMAKEVLIVTPSIRAAIKNNNADEIYMMINQAADLGMITMEQDLKQLYLSKRISYENAFKYANNKTLFRQITQQTV